MQRTLWTRHWTPNGGGSYLSLAAMALGSLTRPSTPPVMPLTPFHLGPALLLGTLLPRRLDLPTLLVASVIVDVRVALVLAGLLGGRTHGILTTFLGGTVVALLVAGVVLALPPSVQSLVDHGRLAATDTTPVVIAGALVGTFSHVVLDSVLYFDARPLYPSDWNPFLLGPSAYGPTYAGCVVAGVLGLALFVRRHRIAPGR